ncbi:FadR/GntR family transcriptional regulator [Bailinhaonella thermotolerans]|uniref:FadR family transcriptional regulator n=1 Tax=Bailinhaonella thermotolerans TaxID=1070861 RepID=A0A3A4A4V0_9ACTN|nr:FadR/GntR family transcriptional regulator [Bailinhaonella thermotolerans]RJL22799.1 FadR family transcriptional regulator [Bailinhaonella thermotolerans]
MTTWEPVRRVRAFEAVLDRIESRIAAGTLKAGDRLPGERQLAEALGVSRASVREALRVLEARGVLVSQTGSGPDAGAILAADPDTALSDVLRLHVGLDSLSLDEVIGARLMIERWSAAEAARAAGPEALSRMRAALTAMDDDGLTPAEFVEHDTAFHVAVTEAAGNRLIAHMMRALRASVRHYAVRAVTDLGPWPAAAQGLRADHEAIYRAIAEGDPEAAATAAESHLRRVYPTTPPPPPS